MQLMPDKKQMLLIKHSLDRHTHGTYTRSTVVDGLSVLCKAVSLVNDWRLSQVHQVRYSGPSIGPTSVTV